MTKQQETEGTMEVPEDTLSSAAPTAEETEGVAQLETELHRLQQELTEAQEQVKRQAAEFANFRRRKEQEARATGEWARADVVQRMLDVLDDLARSLEAAMQLEGKEVQDPEAAFQNLRQGVEMVYRKFTDEMARLGVEPIQAVGTPFNENEHEAMLQQPAPEGTAAGLVLGELQKGYRMGERVLRHSKVIVSV